LGIEVDGTSALGENCRFINQGYKLLEEEEAECLFVCLVGAGTRGGGEHGGVSFERHFGGVEGFCWRCERAAEDVLCRGGCPAGEPGGGSKEPS
jgi:hypothetical protein